MLSTLSHTIADASIKELMESKSLWLKIVIVTGSAQHTLLDKLDRDLKGLVNRDLVVCANDVEKGKPDPEPYLKGLQKAGVEPWQARAFIGVGIESAWCAVHYHVVFLHHLRCHIFILYCSRAFETAYEQRFQPNDFSP